MKATRFKGILLIILAILNLFLLILLFVQQSQQRGAYRRSLAELSALYETNGIALDTAQVPQERAISVPNVSRSKAEESAFAKKLLGDVKTASEDGTTYRYYNENGTCRICANGVLDVSCHKDVGDAAAFCRDLAKEFGCRETSSALESGTGTVKLERVINSVPLCNGTLSFSFQNNILTSVNGIFLPKETGKTTPVSWDTVSALVTFLDYRSTAGLVCTKIEDISVCFYAQSSAAALSIIPVLRIKTDIAEYYVNPVNNSVFR